MKTLGVTLRKGSWDGLLRRIYDAYVNMRRSWGVPRKTWHDQVNYILESAMSKVEEIITEMYEYDDVWTKRWVRKEAIKSLNNFSI